MEVAAATVAWTGRGHALGRRAANELEDRRDGAMTLTDKLEAPDTGDDWFALTSQPLPVDVASTWAVRPDCGALVTFVGIARDHSVGRPGVDTLEYEAYDTQVVPRLARIGAAARNVCPSVGRIAMLHRVGPLAVSEAAVVVVVSAPHRDEAFEAARFCIDTLKSTVPIWKKETWADGEAWGLDGADLVEPEQVVARSGRHGNDA